MKHAAAFLCWFVVLWWLWMLFAGEWNRTQWIAAAGAAAIAAFVAEAARTRVGGTAPPSLHVLRSLPAALGMVFVDFALVMWALAVRKRGAFRTTASDAATDDRSRPWATYVALLSSNAYVVDYDTAAGTVLTHHLVPRQASQDPV